jgi:hypothetical protein
MNGPKKLRTPAHRDDGDGRRDLEHLAGRLNFQPTSEIIRPQALEGQPIIIEVAAIGRGLFSATVEGCLIVASSRQPFLDCAHVLMCAGIAAETVIMSVRTGSTTVSLRGRVDDAARFTVEEGPRGPRFRRRQSAPETGVAASPVSPPDLAPRGVVPQSTHRSSAGCHHETVSACKPVPLGTVGAPIELQAMTAINHPRPTSNSRED